MAKEAKFSNEYSQYVYKRCQTLLKPLLNTKKLPKWEINYRRRAEDWEVHCLVVNYIQQYAPAIKDRYAIYYRLMNMFVHDEHLSYEQLKKMFYDKTTEQWKQACEEVHAERKQIPQTPEQIVAEAIGRLKAKAPFLTA